MVLRLSLLCIRLLRVPLLALGAVLFVSIGANHLTGSAQAQGCLSSAQTRSLIASGQIVSLSSINAAARSRGYSQVASASVCGSSGRYTYNVVAVGSGGASARLTFDASSGRLLSER